MAAKGIVVDKIYMGKCLRGVDYMYTVSLVFSNCVIVKLASNCIIVKPGQTKQGLLSRHCFVCLHVI